jgi:hypothetical protein
VRRHIALVALAICAWGTPALAQTPSAGAVEISGGAVFMGGFDFAEATAVLTANAGGSLDQFTTEGRFEPLAGLQARIAYFITQAFAVEGGLRYARPVYSVRISGDNEEAADATAEETLSHYVFDASAVWHFGGGRSRAVPFVFGGAGYLRELHEGDALVEEGTELHAGAGIKWWLGARSRVGLRGEVGFSLRDGGVDYEEKRRIVPVAGGSLIWAF